MTDETNMAIDQPERVTRRMLAEGQIEKVVSPERTAMIPMNDIMGGLKFENAFQLAEAAKLMSTAGPLLPSWLQGNVGGCWAILLRSQETGISPLALAQMTFVTEKKGVQRIGYDSVYFRTMVEKFAPIKERLKVRYEGAGDDLVCIVYATFKGETEPRCFPPPGTEKDFTLAKLHPGHNEYGAVKGSPLWDDKPALQLWYAMSRDWSRMYCSDIVAGAYTRDELAKAGFVETQEVISPRDLSPRLRERLRGPKGEGFEHSMKNIEEAIAAASPDKKRKASEASPPPAGDDDPVHASGSPGDVPSDSNPTASDGASSQEEKA